jgi:hypothetical protein
MSIKILLFSTFIKDLAKQNYLNNEEFDLISQKIRNHASVHKLHPTLALKQICKNHKVDFYTIYQLISNFLTLRDCHNPTQLRLRKKMELRRREDKIFDLHGWGG